MCFPHIVLFPICDLSGYMSLDARQLIFNFQSDITGRHNGIHQDTNQHRKS